MAGITRHTVEREIGRGNLKAEMVGGRWVIDPAEAERWSAAFKPYSALRKQGQSHGGTVSLSPATGEPGDRRPGREVHPR
jgi:hypothetical protein